MLLLIIAPLIASICDCICSLPTTECNAIAQCQPCVQYPSFPSDFATTPQTGDYTLIIADDTAAASTINIPLKSLSTFKLNINCVASTKALITLDPTDQIDSIPISFTNVQIMIPDSCKLSEFSGINSEITNSVSTALTIGKVSVENIIIPTTVTLLATNELNINEDIVALTMGHDTLTYATGPSVTISFGNGAIINLKNQNSVSSTIVLDSSRTVNTVSCTVVFAIYNENTLSFRNNLDGIVFKIMQSDVFMLDLQTKVDVRFVASAKLSMKFSQLPNIPVLTSGQTITITDTTTLSTIDLYTDKIQFGSYSINIPITYQFKINIQGTIVFNKHGTPTDITANVYLIIVQDNTKLDFSSMDWASYSGSRLLSIYHASSVASCFLYTADSSVSSSTFNNVDSSFNLISFDITGSCICSTDCNTDAKCGSTYSHSIFNSAADWTSAFTTLGSSYELILAEEGAGTITIPLVSTNTQVNIIGKTNNNVKVTLDLASISSGTLYLKISDSTIKIENPQAINTLQLVGNVVFEASTTPTLLQSNSITSNVLSLLSTAISFQAINNLKITDIEQKSTFATNLNQIVFDSGLVKYSDGCIITLEQTITTETTYELTSDIVDNTKFPVIDFHIPSKSNMKFSGNWVDGTNRIRIHPGADKIKILITSSNNIPIEFIGTANIQTDIGSLKYLPQYSVSTSGKLYATGLTSIDFVTTDSLLLNNDVTISKATLQGSIQFEQNQNLNLKMANDNNFNIDINCLSTGLIFDFTDSSWSTIAYPLSTVITIKGNDASYKVYGLISSAITYMPTIQTVQFIPVSNQDICVSNTPSLCGSSYSGFVASLDIWNTIEQINFQVADVFSLKMMEESTISFQTTHFTSTTSKFVVTGKSVNSKINIIWDSYSLATVPEFSLSDVSLEFDANYLSSYKLEKLTLSGVSKLLGAGTILSKEINCDIKNIKASTMILKATDKFDVSSIENSPIIQINELDIIFESLDSSTSRIEYTLSCVITLQQTSTTEIPTYSLKTSLTDNSKYPSLALNVPTSGTVKVLGTEWKDGIRTISIHTSTSPVTVTVADATSNVPISFSGLSSILTDINSLKYLPHYSVSTSGKLYVTGLASIDFATTDSLLLNNDVTISKATLQGSIQFDLDQSVMSLKLTEVSSSFHVVFNCKINDIVFDFTHQTWSTSTPFDIDLITIDGTTGQKIILIVYENDFHTKLTINNVGFVSISNSNVCITDVPNTCGDTFTGTIVAHTDWIKAQSSNYKIVSPYNIINMHNDLISFNSVHFPEFSVPYSLKITASGAAYNTRSMISIDWDGCRTDISPELVIENTLLSFNNFNDALQFEKITMTGSAGIKTEVIGGTKQTISAKNIEIELKTFKATQFDLKATNSYVISQMEASQKYQIKNGYILTNFNGKLYFDISTTTFEFSLTENRDKIIFETDNKDFIPTMTMNLDKLRIIAFNGLNWDKTAANKITIITSTTDPLRIHLSSNPPLIIHTNSLIKMDVPSYRIYVVTPEVQEFTIIYPSTVNVGADKIQLDDTVVEFSPNFPTGRLKILATEFLTLNYGFDGTFPSQISQSSFIMQVSSDFAHFLLDDGWISNLNTIQKLLFRFEPANPDIKAAVLISSNSNVLKLFTPDNIELIFFQEWSGCICSEITEAACYTNDRCGETFTGAIFNSVYNWNMAAQTSFNYDFVLILAYTIKEGDRPTIDASRFVDGKSLKIYGKSSESGMLDFSLTGSSRLQLVFDGVKIYNQQSSYSFTSLSLTGSSLFMNPVTINTPDMISDSLCSSKGTFNIVNTLTINKVDEMPTISLSEGLIKLTNAGQASQFSISPTCKVVFNSEGSIAISSTVMPASLSLVFSVSALLELSGIFDSFLTVKSGPSLTISAENQYDIKFVESAYVRMNFRSISLLASIPDIKQGTLVVEQHTITGISFGNTTVELVKDKSTCLLNLTKLNGDFIVENSETNYNNLELKVGAAGESPSENAPIIVTILAVVEDTNVFFNDEKWKEAVFPQSMINIKKTSNKIKKINVITLDDNVFQKINSESSSNIVLPKATVTPKLSQTDIIIIGTVSAACVLIIVTIITIVLVINKRRHKIFDDDEAEEAETEKWWKITQFKNNEDDLYQDDSE